jgi:D-amino-acid dehydrogenase
MRVIVLGAGVIGITSAWYLSRRGFDVTVVERAEGPALETSFANGGQISVSHAEPWANPGAPWKVLKWLLREDAPLLFRLRSDPVQWRWCLQFLRECTPARTAANIRNIFNLSLYSRQALQQLRAETGIAYRHLETGILHFYTDAREYAAELPQAELLRQLGVDRQPVTPDEIVAIEPALAGMADQLVGGTYTASDESGDAHIFTQQLTYRCAAAGVTLHYDTSVLGIERHGDQVTGIRVRSPQGEQRLQADAYVVALGSYTPQLLAPLGMRVPIYPAKGYSATFPVLDSSRAPQVSVTDDARKMVFTRLGNELRVAGTAELTGYNLDLNTIRCEALTQRTAELFPGAVALERVRYWTGLRPATPSNVPIIGRSPLRNLYINSGHGTLGWTMACGSGLALADLVSGQPPEVAFAFIGR